MLTEVLLQPPYIKDLISEYRKSRLAFEETSNDLEMWQSRLTQFENTYSYVKPRSRKEMKGLYDPLIFRWTIADLPPNPIQAQAKLLRLFANTRDDSSLKALLQPLIDDDNDDNLMKAITSQYQQNTSSTSTKSTPELSVLWSIFQVIIFNACNVS